MPYSRLTALTLLLAVAPAITGSPTTTRVATAETSLFLGVWELDLTRMPETYGPPPKRVIYHFQDIGGGHWRARIEITAPDDSVRRVAITFRRDGRAVQGTGDQSEGDHAAFNSPEPDVLVMAVGKDKVLGGVRVYTLSPDGNEMTEAATGTDSNGAPFIRNFHFRRVG